METYKSIRQDGIGHKGPERKNMKTVKTIYLIVIISITVFVVGFFGARKIRAFSGLFSDADIVKDSVTVEPFKEVKLVADVANFTIVEGDDYHVDYEYPDSMALKGKVENEVLKIELKGKKNQGFGFLKFDKNGIKSAEPKITVYVPKGTELSKADLTISAGNVNLSDKIFDSLKADCDAGNINLNKITANKVEIEADAGNIEINHSVLGDCEYHTSAGRIAIDNTVMNKVEAETSMGEIDLDNIIFANGEVNSDMGAITIDGSFDELKSHTSMGRISIDNEKLDTAKMDLSVDMGEVVVNGNGKGSSFKQD